MWTSYGTGQDTVLCRRRASPLLGAAEGGDYTARGSGLRCCSGCSRRALRRALESCVRLLQAAHNTKPLALNSRCYIVVHHHATGAGPLNVDLADYNLTDHEGNRRFYEKGTYRFEDEGSPRRRVGEVSGQRRRWRGRGSRRQQQPAVSCGRAPRAPLAAAGAAGAAARAAAGSSGRGRV